MYKKLYFLLTVCVFCCFGSLYAENYHFVTLDFPPLQFTNTTGKVDGAVVKIVTTVMTHLGHDVTIEVLPWERALRMVKDGRADAIFTAYKNDERELFFDYSREMLIQQVVSFYTINTKKIAIPNDLIALKNKRIGTTSTISYGKKFDAIRDKLNTIRSDSLEANLDKLINGQLDLIISNIYVADYTVDHLNFSKSIIRLYPEVERVPSFIAFSKTKKLTALRDAFDKELKKIKLSGEYKKTLAAYGLAIE